MAFRIRRGPSTNIGSINPPPQDGELFYVQDLKQLWVGDDEGNINLVSSPVASVNGLTGPVSLSTDDILEGIGNKYFSSELAQDAVWAALNAGNAFNTGITFSYVDSSDRLTATVTYPDVGSVNSSSATNMAYYATTSRAISGTAFVTWNENTKKLSLADSTVVVNTITPAQAALQLNSYLSNGDIQSVTQFRRARGSASSPLSLTTPDIIHSLSFDAYSGTQYNQAGAISFALGTGQTTTNSPGMMIINVTGNDGNPTTMRLDQSGRLSLGPYYPADPGNGGFSVTQVVSAISDFPMISGIQAYDDSYGGIISLTKTRGTHTTPLSVQAFDGTGTIRIFAHDGTSEVITAEMLFYVDGAVSTGIVPGAILTRVPNNSGVMTGITTLTKRGLSIDSGALKLPIYADATARDAALPSPEAGMVVFLTAGTKMQVNTNSTTGGWVDVN
jgi:hypothetical protein